jgi:hypothetical protein
MKYLIIVGLFSFTFLHAKAQNNQTSEAQFINNISDNSIIFSATENTIQYSIYNPVNEIKNLSNEIVKNYCRKYKLDYVGYYQPSSFIKEKYSLINNLNDQLKEHLAIFNRENTSSLLIAKGRGSSKW